MSKGLAAAIAIPALAFAYHAGAQDRPAVSCGSEDSAGWDWSRCGNHRRGVTLRDGRRVTVTPGAWCLRVAADAIDWQATAHLQGDAICRGATAHVRGS